MKYIYNITIKSEFPPQVIEKKLDKVSDEFTVVETIEEVNDETPPDEQIIQEIPFLYV